MRRCTRIMGTACFFCLLLLDCFPTSEQLLDTPASASVKFVLKTFVNMLYMLNSVWSQPTKKQEKKEDQEHTVQLSDLDCSSRSLCSQRKREGMRRRCSKQRKKQGWQLQQQTETSAASSVEHLVIGPETVLTTTTMNLFAEATNSRGGKDTMTNAQGVQLLPSQTEGTSQQWMGEGRQTQPAIATGGSGTHRHTHTPRQNSNRLTIHYTMHRNFYLISAHRLLYVFTVHGAFKKMTTIEMNVDGKPWSSWWLPSLQTKWTVHLSCGSSHHSNILMLSPPWSTDF